MTIQKQPHATTGVTIPARIGDSAEINYGEAPAPDFGPLARDKVPVRAMKESDFRELLRSTEASPVATVLHISRKD